MQKNNRTLFFIDGFNVYHAIKTRRLGKYRWLNYWELATKFLQPKDLLVGVLYFTAIPPWDIHKSNRHKCLISANQFYGVEVISGKFRYTTKRCRECHQEYHTYEEKRTDVNIAIHLLKNAYENNYDKAVLVSGDSDLIPAIEAVKGAFPNKEFSLVIPIKRQARELKQIIGSSMSMKEQHLKTSQLPKKVTLTNGVVLQRPIQWR